MTPASIRNNNPGAAYPGPSSRKFGSTTFEVLRSKDGVHKIATFPTATHGAAAMFDLLCNGRRMGRYLYRGKPVRDAIKTWCGGFYADTYVKRVQDKGGPGPSEILTEEFIRDPAKAIPLAQAMAWQEAGRDFPLEQAEWEAAHAMAFGSAKAPAWTPENDVPTPKPETRAAETTATAVKATGAVGFGGGTVALASPPDLSALTGWQGAIETGKGLVLWAQGSWLWIVAAGALYALIAYGGPWLKERMGG